MLPSNVDPRRPEKVQRYKPPTANTSGQGEDLTPDYMNILGQHRATTANAASSEPSAASDKHVVDAGVGVVNVVGTATVVEQPEEKVEDAAPPNSNVIPTSPQYGVAIIPTNVSVADLPSETVTVAADAVIDSTVKQPPDDSKDLHSTPSRNDRFKVVKIASLEPFKRGRWKCMDYVDEAPPPITQPSKVPPSSVPTTGVFLQTQSLPQQQIQQMLLQSGFTNGTQFFQNVPAQMVPQTQYFYPQTQQLAGVPQFINTSQPYFATPVQNSGFAVPANYQNVQYVPANLIQNQGSAFVPTSQTVQLPANFQQSQTYAGQANVNPPMVNGHAYPQQNEPGVTASIPTQPAKSVILTSTSVPQPIVTQAQITQPVQIPVAQSNAPPVQNQQYQQNFQQVPSTQTAAQTGSVQNAQSQPHIAPVFDQSQAGVDKNTANSVYTNPQFDMHVNSLTVLETAETSAENITEANSGTEVTSENPDDPSKTNPVVNAIDNKIEQAMDLVKSHLMYTVREEVEVLKEKIAELMERIQQLETENNFLRSQIPKSQAQPTAGTPILTTSTPVVHTTTTSSNEAAQQ